MNQHDKDITLSETRKETHAYIETGAERLRARLKEKEGK